jgi:Protein of unknown function (DUF2000)
MTGQVLTRVETLRCVVVVDESLPAGLAANAVGMVAITLGAAVSELPGPPLIDADGGEHPGLTPQGITVLRATAARLGELRAAAIDSDELGVIDFPADCQMTTDYDEVRRRVALMAAGDVQYRAVLVYGTRKAVARLTGNLPLLR